MALLISSLQSATRLFQPFLFFIWLVLDNFVSCFFYTTSQAGLTPWILVMLGHRIATVFRVTKIKVTEAVNQEKSTGVRKSFQPFC